MNHRHSLLNLIAILGGALLCIVSCTEKPADNLNGTDSFDIQITLPTSIEISKGGEYTFECAEDKGLLTTDQFLLDLGVLKPCTITSATPTSFTVRFPASCETGDYKIVVKRGERKKSLGTLHIQVVTKIDFEPDPSSTVYGQITCDGAGVPDVVVTDGVEVVKTDGNGIYQIASRKYWGYVAMSIPSGYEAVSDGVFPKFHSILRNDAKKLERADFELVRVSGQDNHVMLMMGDMHLANRNNDIAQFSSFTSEINAYVKSNNGSRIYGLTLGDMTWDLYWTSNQFDFTNYVKTINDIKGMQIFHTIGNHDHEMMAAGDFNTVTQFKHNVAPTFYSFNIGKVHYVVIDDIECTNPGTGDRTYNEKIVNDQLLWLRKDLEHVPVSTPLVFAMHAPVQGVQNKSDFISIIAPYETVHVVSGHTHRISNYVNEEYMEHVSGAVCADWWWSGKTSPGLLMSTDGTPAGYAIWTINGTDMKWLYKSIGKPESHQFRSYDLNNVAFGALQGCSASDAKKYQEAYPANSKNEVLINVWNWNPDWTVSVKDESGRELECKKVNAYDPLHIEARFSGVSSTSNFSTQNREHFFKVTAGNADMDLTITVTDEFGNVWTENMQRPKAFSKNAYK